LKRRLVETLLHRHTHRQTDAHTGPIALRGPLKAGMVLFAGKIV